MSGFFKRRKRKASVLEAERIDLDQEVDSVSDVYMDESELELRDFAEEVAKCRAKECARNRRWKR